MFYRFTYFPNQNVVLNINVFILLSVCNCIHSRHIYIIISWVGDILCLDPWVVSLLHLWPSNYWYLNTNFCASCFRMFCFSEKWVLIRKQQEKFCVVRLKYLLQMWITPSRRKSTFLSTLVFLKITFLASLGSIQNFYCWT